MNSSDLETVFFEYVPEQFCRRVLRMIFNARRSAHDHCRAEFPPSEADNVRPWYTRGKVETQLREVTDLHAADGMTHQVLRAPKSGWNHTEVAAGPILLTAGAVQTPCGLVDKADFRLGLARSNQDTLFEDGDVGSRIYVMLLHSPFRSTDPSEDAKYAHLPGSAYLAFPASDLDSYLHTINLFDKYPDIVKDNLPQDWDDSAIVRFMFSAEKSPWSGAA